MSVMGRALRNVFRKPVRSIVVIMIIGFCLGIFITMSIVNANIADRSKEIASQQSETEITIRAAGSYGGFSSEVMNESIMPKIQAAPHITSVQKVITHMNQSEGTSGQSFPSPGQRPSGGFNFRMRSIIQGEDPSTALILTGGGTMNITSGRTLNANDKSSNVAVIGSNYSQNNNVAVNGAIDLNGTSVTVVGIYSTGNRFGDNSVIVPYDAMKKIYSVAGMNEVYVNVDYAGNVNGVVSALNNTLGSNYDIVPASSRTAMLQNSINTISANSETGLMLALVTGVAVMIFIMILITRERTKEIGVLKAIGFKNSSIVTQFFVESVVLAVLGFVIGLVIVSAAGPSIANVMLTRSSGATGGGGPGGGFGGFGGGMFFLTNENFTPQPGLILNTLVLSIVLGIVGSVYPILKAIRLKPAEALRYE